VGQYALIVMSVILRVSSDTSRSLERRRTLTRRENELGRNALEEEAAGWSEDMRTPSGGVWPNVGRHVAIVQLPAPGGAVPCEALPWHAVSKEPYAGTGPVTLRVRYGRRGMTVGGGHTPSGAAGRLSTGGGRRPHRPGGRSKPAPLRWRARQDEHAGAQSRVRADAGVLRPYGDGGGAG
jgi:hypothetical protein